MTPADLRELSNQLRDSALGAAGNAAVTDIADALLQAADAADLQAAKIGITATATPVATEPAESVNIGPRYYSQQSQEQP